MTPGARTRTHTSSSAPVPPGLVQNDPIERTHDWVNKELKRRTRTMDEPGVDTLRVMLAITALRLAVRLAQHPPGRPPDGAIQRRSLASREGSPAREITIQNAARLDDFSPAR